MRYDRKVRYLDYCENGERIRGGGFFKTEISGDSFKIELTVKGVRGAGEFAGDVILCGNGREEALGKIQLVGGQGEFRHTCHVDFDSGDTIGSTGIGCDEMTGIKIPLGEGREIICTWDAPNPTVRSSAEQSPKTVVQPQAETPVMSTAKQQEKVRKKAVREHMPRLKRPEPRREVKAQDLRESEAAHSEQQEARLEGRAQERRETEAAPLEQNVPRREERARERRESEALYPERKEARQDGKAREQQSEAVPLMENKWLQLCAIYPHVNPFKDKREYLSIGPEDFVLLSSDSYKAASNSFMLHGYYNYRHLILAREERRGEIVYYVGVPGNYYDREKQVAIMFGFESFECAQEPAQSSDFGYYMMKVQL